MTAFALVAGFAAVAALDFFSPQVLAQEVVLGEYRADGTNPNGSRYHGTATITAGGGNTYIFRWRISGQTFRGTGRLDGRTLTVDWGQSSPVIYRLGDDGTLRGTWDNGRATDNLTPTNRQAAGASQPAEAKSAGGSDSKVCLKAYDDGLTESNAAVEEACARYIQSGQARGKFLASAYYARATSFMFRGDFDRALQEQNEAIRLWPDSPYYRNQRAAIYASMGDYTRGLVDAEEAVRLDPKKGMFRESLANLYERMKDYDRTLAEIAMAIKLDPKDTRLIAQRCGVYFLKGEYDRALSDCDEAIRRDPKKGGGFGYTRRCQIYASKGDFVRALRDCDEEIAQNPQSVSGHTWRGFIYERKGEREKAILNYQLALEISPAGKAIHIPPAIGETIEDVQTHLARLQSSVTAGSAGPTKQTDARTVFERRGVIGVWAGDCSSAVSPQNSYTVYRAIDERRVQRDVMIGANQRGDVAVIDSVIEAGDDLSYQKVGQTRDDMRIRVTGNRLRLVDLKRDGTIMIAEGNYLSAYGEAFAGRPTPWATKCQ